MFKYVFEVYKDKKKLYRWRLREVKGRKRIIADSGEGYSKRFNAIRALDRMTVIIKVGDWYYSDSVY